VEARPAFLGRTRGHNHLGAESLGELNGGGADPARAAMHQKPFAGRKAAAFKDVAPDRAEGFGNRRGPNGIETGRDRQGLHVLNEAVLGVAATVDESTDLVAGPPAADLLAQRNDFAGDLEAREWRSAGRRRIGA